MPVLALGNSRLGDVYTHLTAVKRVQEFRERASCIHIHLVVVDGFLLWEVREIGGHQLVAEATLWEGNHVDAVLVGCCIGTLVDDVNDFTEGGLVGDWAVAVQVFFSTRIARITRIICRYGIEPVIDTVVGFAFEGGYHLIYKVIDVEEFHFHTAVIDLYREVVGDVVAEGSDGGIVVGAAPLAEEVRETINEHLSTCLLAVFEHQFLASFLALAVFACAESTCKGGLDGAADHHRTVVLVLLQGVEQSGGEAKVALHELFRVFGAVHACKVEHEVAFLAPLIELLWSGVDVVFIDGFDRLREIVPLCLAIAYILELGAEVSAYEPLCSCY